MFLRSTCIFLLYLALISEYVREIVYLFVSTMSCFPYFSLAYTELATTVVNQVISIPFTGSANLLKFHLALLAGSVETVSQKSDNVQYRVFDAINITWRPQQITMEVSYIYSQSELQFVRD